MNFRRFLLDGTAFLRSPDDGSAGGGGGGDGKGADGGGKGAGGGGDGKGGQGGSGSGGGGGGGGDKKSEPFYASYGLDQAGADYLAGKGFKEPKDIVASLRHFETIARDRNVISKPDPKDAKFGDHEVHELLGWVKDEAAYRKGLTRPKADGVDLDEGASGALLDALTKIGHEARVPLATMQKIHDGLFGFMAGKVTELKSSGAARLADLDTALRAEWKGDYDTKAALARRAYAAFNADPDAMKAMAAVMGDPRAVKQWAEIGAKIGEAHLPGGAAGGGGMGLTPESARAERRRLESNSEWMAVFNDERHPLHADHAAHRARLLKIEAGERA